MKKEEWNEGLNHLESDVIEKYVEQRDGLMQKNKKSKNMWIRFGAMAACLCLILGAIRIIPIVRNGGSGTSYPTVSQPSGTSYPTNNQTPGIYQTTFCFDTYEEMIEAFVDPQPNSDYYEIYKLKSDLDESYSYFVDKIREDEAFPQPLFDNKPITYQNEKGFSNMTFFVQESYGLPWIWYFPYVSTGENFYIQVTYLPNNIANQGDLTASEAIKLISPNAINIDNLGKNYDDVYNKKIKLYDREVIAMVCKLKDDTRDFISFVYDDLLIVVRCDPEVWTAEWFSRLSFGIEE